MMRRRYVLGTLGLVGVILTAGAGASAANAVDVPIDVWADAYATDGSGQITSDSRFLFDPDKGEMADDAYQIAYRGNLEMASVWREYQGFKSIWMGLPGQSASTWKKRTFSGDWDISFSSDISVVTPDPMFVDCAVVQAEIVAQNPGTRFGEIMRCTQTAYDDETGRYTAHFQLRHENGRALTGADLDMPEYQPASLHLTTPPGAFYVRQSSFVSGKTFTMHDPTVTGTIRMNGFLGSLMPVNFAAVGAPVTLEMTPAFRAHFGFASLREGRELPQEVLELLPETQKLLQNGATVIPADPAELNVANGAGRWEFRGWDLEQGVVQDGDITFTGSWAYAVDPEAHFAVSYRFVPDAELDEPLPADVEKLLPEPHTAMQGAEVRPALLSSERFREQTMVDGARIETVWEFGGWSSNREIIDGADVEFVGSWVKSQTTSGPDGTGGGPGNVSDRSEGGPTTRLAHSGGAESLGVAVAAGLLLLGVTALCAPLAARRRQH